MFLFIYNWRVFNISLQWPQNQNECVIKILKPVWTCCNVYRIGFCRVHFDKREVFTDGGF